MKDYEKRQYDKKGRYKGSIHDKSKNAKKHVSWATVIFWGIVIVFVLMALADN